MPKWNIYKIRGLTLRRIAVVLAAPLVILLYIVLMPIALLWYVGIAAKDELRIIVRDFRREAVDFWYSLKAAWRGDDLNGS